MVEFLEANHREMEFEMTNFNIFRRNSTGVSSKQRSLRKVRKALRARVEGLERRQLLSITFNSNPWASSVATDFPLNYQQFESAFTYAEQQFTALFPNANVTANLTVAANALGGADANTSIPLANFGSYSYSTVLAKLPDLPTVKPAQVSQVLVPSIEARALQLPGAPTPSSDATITFNDSLTWNFNPADRSNTTTATFDFIGVAEHEIAHALGRVDLFGNGNGSYTPFDLCRYTLSSKTLDINGTSPDGLSTNHGTTLLPGLMLDPQSSDPSDYSPGTFSNVNSAAVATITKVNETNTIVNVTANNSFQTGQEVLISGLSPFADLGNGTAVTITGASPFTFIYNAPPQQATSENETGTICNIVMNNNFSIGQQVVVSGMQRAAYNGLFTITGASPGSFTYNAYAAPITAITESSSTVTVTATNSFEAGDSVVISGISPSGYDGTFTIATATPTGFTYTDTHTGLGAGSGSGTAQPIGIPNASTVGTVTRYGAPLTTTSGSAYPGTLDSFNAASGAVEDELTQNDLIVMGQLLGYGSNVISSDSGLIEGEQFLFNSTPVTTLYPGGAYTANLTFYNSGGTTWSSGASYDVYYPGSGMGVPVSPNVAPGGTYHTSFAFIAGTSGSETFQLVHQNVDIFGEVAQIPIEGQGQGGAVNQQGQLTLFNVQENGVWTPMTSNNGATQVLAPNTQYYFQIQYENEGEADWGGAASPGTPGAWLIVPYTTQGSIIGPFGNNSNYVPTGAQINSVYNTSGTHGSFWTAYFTFQTGIAGSYVQFGMLQQQIGYFGDVAAFSVGSAPPGHLSSTQGTLTTASAEWTPTGQFTSSGATDEKKKHRNYLVGSLFGEPNSVL
ncbi:MAG TPA: hypothetical protein VH370_12035 [Humisphaera sp.]|nr:hypothetical protein [Humisphaera sp.]